MKTKLVTFHFKVVRNFSNYSGVNFYETHVLPEKVSPLDWANKNLSRYFLSDFSLENIESV